MVLDTNAVSAFLSGAEGLKKKIEGARSPSIPAIAAALESLLRDVEVLAVSRDTARHYTAVRAHLKTAGTPIPENDVWIAAIVRQYEQYLVSNDAHFDYVPGITRIAW